MVVGPIIGPIPGSPVDLGVRPRQHSMGLVACPNPSLLGSGVEFHPRHWACSQLLMGLSNAFESEY